MPTRNANATPYHERSSGKKNTRSGICNAVVATPRHKSDRSLPNRRTGSRDKAPDNPSPIIDMRPHKTANDTIIEIPFYDFVSIRFSKMP